MSHNLDLDNGAFSLWQTPTRITFPALAGDTKAIYIGWLDEIVIEAKPSMHPRATNAQRKAVQSTQKWKDWLILQREIEDHKAALNSYLTAHPRAEWGST